MNKKWQMGMGIMERKLSILDAYTQIPKRIGVMSMTREMYKVVRYFDTYPEKIIESNVEYEYTKKLASVLNNRNKKPYVTYEILKEL